MKLKKQNLVKASISKKHYYPKFEKGTRILIRNIQHLNKFHEIFLSESGSLNPLPESFDCEQFMNYAALYKSD